MNLLGALSSLNGAFFIGLPADLAKDRNQGGLQTHDADSTLEVT
jgi:hypothetical protein